MSWRQPETTTQRRQRTQRRVSHGDTETQRFVWSEKTDPLCLSVSVAKPLCELPTLCVLLVGNGRDLPRLERFEEAARRFDVELRIPRFNAEKEPVAAGEREPRQVENRVIRLRQPVERQHAEH